MATQDRPLRPGNKSLENVIRTDERYGSDGLLLGPRGRDYGRLLEHPRPIQIANLYPDQNSSYWVAQMELPPGATLIFHGQYPYGRYFQYALYRPDPLGSYTATSESRVDYLIEPDKGSVNPFVPGNPRLGAKRNYTLRVEASDIPKKRNPNTLYAGKAGKFQMVYRVYLPDVNRDGSGGVGLPTYEVALKDGTIVPAEGVVKRFSRPMSQGVASGMTTEQWLALRNAPDNDPALDPDTTPARNPAVAERYFNNKYNLIGPFKTPQARAQMSPKVEAGFGGDPVTLFMFAFTSRKFGPVLVIRGKMPRFPDTFMGKNGKGLETMTDWECRYWSVIQSEAPPSGFGNDALTDMQVPLDKDRNYTIVVSRAEDRPANATEENGVAWMDWGTRGEGLNHPANRTDFGFLVFRFMGNNPKWKYNPDKITVPGTEAEVMGPYCPRFEYTDKATFEAGAQMGGELPCLVCPFASDLLRAFIRPGDQAIAKSGESVMRGFEHLLLTLESRAGLPGLAAGTAGQLNSKIGQLRTVISKMRESSGLGNQLPCTVCPFATDLMSALIRPGSQALAAGLDLHMRRIGRIESMLSKGGDGGGRRRRKARRSGGVRGKAATRSSR